MRAYEAYRMQRDSSAPRVDLIITAFRKILSWLAEADTKLAQGNKTGATALLLRSQAVIAALAGGVAGSAEEPGASFFRLYEFASHCLARGNVGDIAAAQKILRILLEGFEAARDQAATLEAQGVIAPLGSEHSLQLTV